MPANCTTKTLHLLPGTYSGPQNTKIELSGDENFTVVISSQPEKATTIDGDGNSWLFNVRGSMSLRLEHISLVNGFGSPGIGMASSEGGAAVRVTEQASVFASWCLIERMDGSPLGHGGAIHFASSGVFRFDHCIFQHNFAPSAGLSIWANDGNGWFNDTIIRNCTGSPAVWIEGSCHLDVYGGAIRDNTAIQGANTAGGLHIAGTAVVLLNGTALVHNGGNMGGAVDVGESGQLTAVSCMLSRNWAIAPDGYTSGPYITGDGGAIYYKSRSPFMFDRCTFSHNYCYQGYGGALCLPIGIGTIANCSFVSNTIPVVDRYMASAWGWGGAAIHLAHGTPVKFHMYDSHIVGNTGGEGTVGGAMRIYRPVFGSEVVIERTLFQSNSVLPSTGLSGGGVGGAIMITAGSGNAGTLGTLSFIACIFDGNSANFGGAICGAFEKGSVIIDGTTFRNNAAILLAGFERGGSGVGGAVASHGFLTIRNCIFDSNQAGASGGAIFYSKGPFGPKSGSLCLTVPGFVCNPFKIGSDSFATPVQLKCCNGGSCKSSDLDACTLEAAGVCHVSPNCTGFGMSKKWGLSKMKLYTNTASLDANDEWAVYITNQDSGNPIDPDLSVESTIFCNNSAGLSGGALELSSPIAGPRNLAFTSCGREFFGCNNGNFAPVPPPALEGEFRSWALTFLAIFGNSTFDGNSVTSEQGLGGAISASNVLITSVGVSFKSNIASYGGGAVYLANAASIQANSSNWEATNVAGDRGGHQVLSDGGGSLVFGPSTKVHFGQGSGLHAPQVGRVIWASDSLTTCPLGMIVGFVDQLQNTSLEGWSLDPGPNSSNCPEYFIQCSLHYAGITPAKVQPKVLVTNLAASCEPCSEGRYSVMQAHVKAGVPNRVLCNTCPFGGNCNNQTGRIVAKNGFWGVAKEGEQVEIAFTTCPPNFCCENASCGAYAACYTGSFRDPAVPLCGTCLPGYSENINNANCSLDATCTAPWWFWPVVLALFLAYAGFFLWSARDMGVGGSDMEGEQHEISQLKQELLGSSDTERFSSTSVQWEGRHSSVAKFTEAALNGGLAVIVFFFQMTEMVVDLKGVANTVMSYCAHIFSLNPSSNSSSSAFAICVWRGFSSITKICTGFASPVCIIIVLYILRMGARIIGRALPPGQFAGSLAQLVIFAFSSVSKATFQLLHCVEVPASSGNSVVFIAANVRCGSWQTPLFIFAVLLVAMPCIPLLVAISRQLPKRWLTKHIARFRWPQTPVALALAISVLRPFKAKHWVWPAVLALQRLLLAAVRALSTDRIKAAETILCISSLALVVQLLYFPYTNKNVNMLQSTAALSLAFISGLAVPLQSFAAAATDIDNSPILKDSVSHLNLAMAFFIMLPLLVVNPLSISVVRRIRRLKQGHRHDGSAMWRTGGNSGRERSVNNGATSATQGANFDTDLGGMLLLTDPELEPSTGAGTLTRREQATVHELSQLRTELARALEAQARAENRAAAAEAAISPEADELSD
jgi:hypothetical protein